MERDIKNIAKLNLLIAAIDAQIETEQEPINTFKERMARDPSDAFALGENAIEAAAKIKLFEIAKDKLTNWFNEGRMECTRDEFYSAIGELIGDRFSIIPCSSSMIHNVMETYLAHNTKRFIERRWEFGSFFSMAQFADEEYKAWQKAEWQKDDDAKLLADAKAKAEKAAAKKAAKLAKKD